MEFEEYKKLVKDCLMKNNGLSNKDAEELIKINVEEVEWFYNKEVIPQGTANILLNPLF